MNTHFQSINMNKIIELLVRHNSDDYIEASQTSRVKFSIATKDPEKDLFYQEYIPFKCKDYFAELVASRILNSILRPVYNFVCKEVWTGEPYITVESSRKQEREGLEKYFYLIQELEISLGVSLEDVSKINMTTLKNTYIIKVNEMWIYNPTMISLFTLIVRGLSSVNYLKSDLVFKSLSEIFKFLSEKEISDQQLYYSLETSTFNWYKFLQNYKEVIGINILTGVNDAQLVDNFKLNIFSMDLNYEDNGLKHIRWTSSINHNFTGIYTLSQNIANNYLNLIGRDWVINYKNIK